MNNTRMYWLQAITPLHVGSGKGVGFIDMPIIREKVTSWPLVPGSAVKGVMRDHFSNLNEGESISSDLFDAAFGKRSDDKDDGQGGNEKISDNTANAGSLILTDAHIVCFPIRSLYGTFAYITSQLVLERLKRDLKSVGYENVPVAPKACDKEALHALDSKLTTEGKKIYFEDLDFDAIEDEETDQWAELLSNLLFSDDLVWKGIFKERFAVVSDDCFNFLSETGTDVAAHVRIKNETKIVDTGALWYEEALPSETIMAGISWCDRVFGKKYHDQDTIQNTILDTFCPLFFLNIQIGGKATVGKGRVRCLFTKVQT